MQRVHEMLREGGWDEKALVFPPSAARDVMRIFAAHKVDILQTSGSVALQKAWHAYVGGAAGAVAGGLVWQCRPLIIRGLTHGLRSIMSAEASGIWATRLGSVACGNVAGAAGVAVGCAVSAALPSMFKQRYQVVMQRREDKHEIIMLDSGVPSRELLLGCEAEEMLASITGQAEFKQMIRDGALLEHQNRLRSQAGNGRQRHRPGHVLLKGKPGTGKTTAARIYASILYHLGLIPNNRLVEVQRGDLVGQYIGLTEHKTKCKIREAMGGVLFVDEAYQLATSSDVDFGKNALEEIMSVMERGDPVIVFAGYPDRMETFLEANDGLKRRIQHTFTFQDFSTQELAQIFLRKAKQGAWRLNEVTEEDRTSCARSSKEQARRLDQLRARAAVISPQMEQTLELGLKPPIREFLNLEPSQTIFLILAYQASGSEFPESFGHLLIPLVGLTRVTAASPSDHSETSQTGIGQNWTADEST
ncbi:unnamed protein product [Cladocopium goreaui]|uniref:Protein CfxQ homolog n=1 Tax=Cladocopium goreaui TaxID=2562237 RepID=A0A9P1FFG0_9DINO|nr:unnamed protein product [Cladocopium goreaui]